MINKLKNLIKNLDKKTIKIMKIGFKFCFILSIISSIILLTYIFSYLNPNLFTIGLLLFKTSILYTIEFLICGIVVDSIKKKLI